MPGKGPTVKICEWACATPYEDIPEDARAEALKILYDEVGATMEVEQ